MKRSCAALAAFVIAAAFISTPAAGSGSLNQPPPIHIPYGGKIVTEINFSDDDVLGMIKQVIPALGDLVREIVASGPATGAVPVPMAALANLDMTGLAEAIKDIRNVRMIIARYAGSPDPEVLLRQFNDGVAKAGKFNKVVSDFGFSPGMFAMYVEPGNTGYILVAYDPGQKNLYAARIVGSVDVPALMRWAGEVIKTVAPAMTPHQSPEDEDWPSTEPCPEPGEENGEPEEHEEECGPQNTES